MSTVTAQIAAPTGSGMWGRAFAAMYDPVLWAGEVGGLREHRRHLLGMARGRTLELGSGTGLNLPYYPDDLDELILAEPAAPMRKRLENAARRRRRTATV